MNFSRLGIWFSAARPKTLLAAVIPVMVGSSIAWRDGWLTWSAAGWCLLFALLVQIGTNLANDYFDYIKGADGLDREGPKRAVSSGQIAPAVMLRAFVIVFVLAFISGLNLITFRGWEMLPIGVLSILFGFAYTGGPFPLAYHGLGDFFVFLFFGLVAVMGSYYVQTGDLNLLPFLSAIPVGLLATNILVVNNYRDKETDKRVGKRTLVVLLGKKISRWQYAFSIFIAFLICIVLAILGYGSWILLPLLLVPYSIKLCILLNEGVSGEDYNHLLGKSAGLLMGYGILFSLGIILSVVL